MKVIVTGGCGYIGSHTMVDLIQNGFEVISVDSLINSNEDVLVGIEKITGQKVKNYQIDLSKADSWRLIEKSESGIVGIIHFAALKAVGESVKKPLAYYENNVGALMQVLEWMNYSNIPNLIFSSSCTVYGESSDLPVVESAEFRPTASPYGRTKQICEWLIQDFFKTSGKKAISLRYFNPAGAHDSILIGEAASNIALNLVPVITETAIGKRKSMTVYGSDYNTKDGTCIRDYIHVMDLAEAHTSALQYLLSTKQELPDDAFNLGMGKGLSVLEIIKAFEKVSGLKFNYELGPRRPGDIPAIFADSTKAKRLLNWAPNRTVDDILRTAWEWENVRN
ncbi:MAG: UDP-glucose 4-epimerase GalE [Saprospiraceae bacterium]|nr:UDP-glucose 4-epimerase GalE [Saprospiraceae bacterium]